MTEKKNLGALIISDCGHKFRAIPNRIRPNWYKCPKCGREITTLY